MIEKILVDADNVINGFDPTTVVVYSNDSNNCCISGHSTDDLAYFFIKSVSDGYTEKEFALRDWKSIHGVFSTFYSPDNSDDFKIKISYDSENYPQVFNIKSGRLKMTYFLQNYNFIKNQNDILADYTRKKFNLNRFSDDGHNVSKEMIKELHSLSSLLNEKFFRILTKNDGTYFCYGDENQSSDSACVKITDENIVNNQEDRFFPVAFFISAYKNMCDEKEFKIKLMGDKIILVSENDLTQKVVIIRAKKI